MITVIKFKPPRPFWTFETDLQMLLTQIEAIVNLHLLTITYCNSGKLCYLSLSYLLVADILTAFLNLKTNALLIWQKSSNLQLKHSFWKR